MSKNINVPGCEGYTKIGLDDTFSFHCTQCGKCCIEREDILLNPYDLYKASKELGITIKEFQARYCESYIGKDSRLPIIRLLPTGNKRRCPLLKKGRCMIHNAKPTVCAMFPIGRCVEMEKTDDNNPIMSEKVGYIYKDPECGDYSENHTVREWLGSFNIKENDEFFLLWSKTQAENIKFIRSMSSITQEAIAIIFGEVLYLSYNLDEPFMPQFEQNVEVIKKMKEEILKELDAMKNV